MSSKQRDDALDSTRRLLERELPNVKLEAGGEDDGKWISPPAVPGAEYRWSYWFYSSGECHIYANLVPSQSGTDAKEYVLWYHPFEFDGFNRSSTSLAEAFEHEISLCLHARTRITQQRGHINWTIDLDRQDEQGEWKRVYRFFALRAGWETPQAAGEFATYYAPSLGDVNVSHENEMDSSAEL